MSLYENIKCPVCGNAFAEGDDVVTCPDCGTPHHRECYKELGKCANKNLHGTDFVFNREEKEDNESAHQTDIGDYYIGENADHAQASGMADEYVQQNNSDESNDYRISPQVNIPSDFIAGKINEEIDGTKVSDLMAVVSVNPFKFLSKFRKNKKLNWNWSAFIFGPYYFFFRKMHFQGIIILALRFVCSLIVSAVYYDAISSIGNSIMNIYSLQDKTQMYAEIQKLAAAPEYQKAMTAYLIIIAVTLVLHIISALIVDGIYRKKVINIVKKVDEKVEMGESFSIIGSAMGNESGMNQGELRKLFLARQGGVSVFAPLIAIMVLQLFTNLIL
ncbi:MAG: DUF2628 domain-containing protein [Eubacterium sp.]|nr:DUF2628 domain-containing protein [Eubacterium sp.]